MVSSIHVVTVKMCHCVQGDCSDSGWMVPSSLISSYHVSDCVCEEGWGGDHCNTDKDGCVANPCGSGQCNDLTPSEEVSESRPYTCSSCSAGYRLDDGDCVGKCLLIIGHYYHREIHIHVYTPLLFVLAVYCNKVQ